MKPGGDSFSPGIARWLYKKRWTSLRPIQKQASRVIPDTASDILITAETAGGKTEAAFLPILSELEKNPSKGYQALCISPLKALINNQAERIEDICSYCNVQFTPWHGDIPASRKTSSWKKPSGVLMITPESLESLLLNRSGYIADRFASLKYIVIDEFHAFIGIERGMQLIAQLARLDSILGKSVPRIALSATIGDPIKSLQYLRPGGKHHGVHITDPGGHTNLRLAVKSYIPTESDEGSDYSAAAMDLYRALKGGKHLVFANSRAIVEGVTDLLKGFAAFNGAPVEFFAHHGSLDKSERQHVEQRLKNGSKPTTAVATSTLELGIDIGHIETVNQIGPPSSVSGVRQRLGRSGRRDESVPTLRTLLISTGRGSDPTVLDQLFLGLIQTIAVVELMLERWVEPGNFGKRDVSTLVQQVISMVASGDVTPKYLYSTLCIAGPWNKIPVQEFLQILKALSASEVIKQLSDGTLIIGIEGERLISDYHFYAAFETPEEYKLVAGGKQIGTLPMTTILLPGQAIIFAGSRWRIEDVDTRAMVITLTNGNAGKAPKFGGEPALVSAQVRLRMREIYLGGETPRYLDPQSISDLKEARLQFKINEIEQVPIVRDSKYLMWFVWDSDKVMNALRLACVLNDLPSDIYGPVLIVETAMPWQWLIDLVESTLADPDRDTRIQLIRPVPLGKYDGLLKSDPAFMLNNMIAELVDLDGAVTYITALSKSISRT